MNAHISLVVSLITIKLTRPVQLSFLEFKNILLFYLICDGVTHIRGHPFQSLFIHEKFMCVDVPDAC